MADFSEILGAVKATSAAFEAFQKTNDEKAAELRDRIEALEAARSAGGKPTGSGGATSIGAQAAQALLRDADLLEKTRTLRVEVKAAGDPVTTSEARSVLWGGMGAPTSVVGIQTALRQRVVDAGSVVEYARYTGVQGAAAQQTTEGSAKAAVKPDFTLVTQTAMTVAGYTKVSRQALRDVSELSTTVNIVLRRQIDIALDALLVNGGSGFSGGFEGLATAYTSTVYTPVPDAVSEGVATMVQAGFSPDIVALNPSTWLAVVTAKGTANDHYLSGDYLGTLPTEMRGLRVVLSPSVDAGKALLLDSRHIELVVVGGFSFEAAYASDDFTKNLVTLLGEVRVAPVFRAVGAARLVTPKP